VQVRLTNTRECSDRVLQAIFPSDLSQTRSQAVGTCTYVVLGRHIAPSFCMLPRLTTRLKKFESTIAARQVPVMCLLYCSA